MSGHDERCCCDACSAQFGYDDPLDCDHEEYEVDCDGRATCDFCRAHWWLTAEQHDAYRAAEAEWERNYYEELRRENSLLGRFKSWCARLRWGPALGPSNDEIPF